MKEFRLTKRILFFGGVWGKSSYYKMYTIYVLMSIIFFCFTIAPTFVTEWPNMDIIILNFAVFLTFMETTIKSIILVRTKKQIEGKGGNFF